MIPPGAHERVVIDGDVELSCVIFGEAELSCVIDGEADVQVIVARGEYFPGPYTVIPKAYENQTLLTANKLMMENVLVTEVPTYEVSNEWGKTFYIADNLGG